MDFADTFKIKILLGLFTVDKGKIKILLFKKTGEPYKGYWSLPSKPLCYGQTFKEVVNDLLHDTIGLEHAYTEVFQAFEDKEEYLNDKVVHVTNLGVIDNISATYKRQKIENKESHWFDINLIPKLSYNHAEIIKTMFSYLQKRLKDTDIIRMIFPSDFTMPELQNFCEQIIGKKLDRRNFRKKILALEILEDTGYQNDTSFGRPAKLYKFKEDVDELNLF